MGKTQEGQVLLDDKNNYTPLTTPMVEETARKTRAIIDDLHRGNHIDTMTKKWLLQTPNPPRIPVFYTLNAFQTKMWHSNLGKFRRVLVFDAEKVCVPKGFG